MNKILAFVKLDMRLIKPYLKSVLILFGVGLILGLINKSGETMPAFFMTFLIMIMSFPFAVTEKNSLNVLYGTLTVNRKTVVLGRYTFLLAAAVTGAVVSFIVSIAISAIFGEKIFWNELMIVLCASVMVFLVFTGFQYPLFFKYGYTKAKLASYIPILLMFVVVLLVPSITKLSGKSFSIMDAVAEFTGRPLEACLTLTAIGLAAFAISGLISYRIFSRKDI